MGVGIKIEKRRFQLSDAFNLGLRVKSDGNTGDEESFLAAIEDEKMALESIYADAFAEKICNKSWELKMFLPHLLKHLPPETGAAEKRNQVCFPSKGWGRCKVESVTVIGEIIT